MTDEKVMDDAAEMRRQRDDLSDEMERCHRLLDKHWGLDESTTALDTLEDRLALLLEESSAALRRERAARAELLEALVELADVSPCQNGCAPDDMTCASNKARAAIAKNVSNADS